MELAEVAVSLQLGAQLVVGLLMGINRVFSIFGRQVTANTVVFVKVHRILAAVLVRCNDSTTGSLLGRVDFEEALGRIHVGVIAQLAGRLLQILDALLALAKGLVAASQVVLGDDRQLHT